MKVLHLIPSLNFSGVGRQLALLCHGLPAGKSQVCVLGRDASGISLLDKPSTPVHILGQSRRLDLVALWKLRRLVRSFQPHVIHAWGLGAVRSLAIAGQGKSRLLVGAPLTAQPLTMLDRWLLNRADRIVVRGQAEAKRCALAGLHGHQIAVVPPGIDRGFFEQKASPLGSKTLPARRVICAGNLESHKGYCDAIWALDILHFLFPDIQLDLAGTGPDRDRLETFARRNRIAAGFLGRCGDMPALLNQAGVVWVPSHGNCGVQSALEAMAAGKPVIATDRPSLREIITDGQTGFLIQPGDKIALARRTRELFRNADLPRQMGEAGQRRAATFSAEKFVARTLDLYQELAGDAEAAPAGSDYIRHAKAIKAA